MIGYLCAKDVSRRINGYMIIFQKRLKLDLVNIELVNRLKEDLSIRIVKLLGFIKEKKQNYKICNSIKMFLKNFVNARSALYLTQIVLIST